MCDCQCGITGQLGQWQWSPAGLHIYTSQGLSHGLESITQTRLVTKLDLLHTTATYYIISYYLNQLTLFATCESYHCFRFHFPLVIKFNNKRIHGKKVSVIKKLRQLWDRSFWY